MLAVCSYDNCYLLLPRTRKNFLSNAILLHVLFEMLLYASANMSDC